MDNEVGLLPHTIDKTNSKWMKDPNVRTRTMKLTEESIGVNCCDLEQFTCVLDMTPKAQQQKK